MKEEIRQMWQTALLSGEYEQGNGALRDSKDRYCCLGVLCDLYAKATGKGKWARTDGSWVFFDSDPFDSSTAFLTDGVRKWAGLNKVIPAVKVPSEYEAPINITAVNDALGKTFPEIAELINDL